MGISKVRFCFLQPTDMSRLRVAKLYRGFESFPLRHAVLTAEKSAWIPLKNAGNGRNFANLPETGPEKVCPAMLRAKFVELFSGGRVGVRFRRLR